MTAPVDIEQLSDANYAAAIVGGGGSAAADPLLVLGHIIAKARSGDQA